MRFQPEYWDWFNAGTLATKAGTARVPIGHDHYRTVTLFNDFTYDNDYTFLDWRLRGRVRYEADGLGALIELQDVQLANLPLHAIAPSPAGALGSGGSYASSALRESINSVSVRQAWVRLGDANAAQACVGRQEYVTGLDAPVDDPRLDWLKRMRISQKLIGVNDYNPWSRTMDAARVDVDDPVWHVTGFIGRPTQLEAHFGTEISKVTDSNLSFTVKQSSVLPDSEAQVFWNHYDDDRDVPETDNRAVKSSISAEGGNDIDTLGMHFVSKIGQDGDALLWYAHQTGKWGTETQDANALCAELGIQFSNLTWTPWLRAGLDVYSGDPNGGPDHSVHGTFVPVLTTARQYAPMPFYTFSNLHDLFLQAILSPEVKTQARFELHALTLDTPNDLWYSGSGASEETGSNGFTGRPSGGFKGLATLAALSVEHQFNPYNYLALYVAQAYGGNVVRASYPSSPHASLIYLDYRLKFH